MLQAAGDDRYHLHELLRQFLARQLAEQPQAAAASQTRAAHGRYFSSRLAQRRGLIDTAPRPALLGDLQADFENLRAAWQWAAEGEWAALQDMAYPLFNFLDFSGRPAEAVALFEAARTALVQAAASRERDLALAEVAAWRGWSAIRVGDTAQARPAFEQSAGLYARLGAAPEPGLGSEPLVGLSVVANISGDYETAGRLGAEACRISQTRQDAPNLSVALYALSGAALGQERYLAARQYAERALAVARSLGYDWFAGYCLLALGSVASAEGRLAEAQEHFRSSEAIRRELGHPEGIAVALREQGAVAERQGQIEQARGLLEASLRLYREIGDRGGLAAALTGLGRTALAQSKLDEAQQHFAAALRHAAEVCYVPVILAALAGAGEWLQATSRAAEGEALLAYALAHPASDHDTRERARGRLPAWPRRATAAAPGDMEAVIETALAALAAPWPAGGPVAPPASPLLNARETEILRLVATGLSNQEIASQLVMSPGTIKWYTSQIYGKLQVRGRTQAVIRARELGLLK